MDEAGVHGKRNRNARRSHNRICEACSAQFQSFDVNEGERVVKAQFDSHECKPLAASQTADGNIQSAY
jgi:hypothetical protein